MANQKQFIALVWLLTLLQLVQTEDDFKPIFDGKTLNGWHMLPGGKWDVRDGMIVGTSLKSELNHGLLLSNDQYSDFEIRFKFCIITGNSGFYFRSEKVTSKVGVNGFQAEIDQSLNISGLYETGGRTWVIKPNPDQIETLYKKNDWNEMSVTAIGKDITVMLNGKKSVELKDDPGRLKGHFALQLHGGMAMEVMFKDLEIKDLSKSASKP